MNKDSLEMLRAGERGLGKFMGLISYPEID